MNRKERDLDEQEGRKLALSCFMVLGFFAGFMFRCCSSSLLLDPARLLACLPSCQYNSEMYRKGMPRRKVRCSLASSLFGLHKRLLL
jgi:hypothetical protein